MKIIVLPDIHNKVKRADRIINQDYDLCICLGDVFDSFYDNVAMAEASAHWLNEFVDNKKHIFLWGNHDIAYCFANSVTRCSGFTWEKHKAIHKIVRNETWTKIRPFYHVSEGNWLLSHAGFNPKIFTRRNLESLDDDCRNGLAAVARGRISNVFAAGHDRGGVYEHGGIIWQDWRNLTLLSEFHQLVGHTKVPFPTVKYVSENAPTFKQSTTEFGRFNGRFNPERCIAVNIDTDLGCYAVLQDGVLKTYSI